MVKNNTNNAVKWVPFSGDHEYFEDGKLYTISMYSNWTRDHSKTGRIGRATLKGRLKFRAVCEPHCLLQKEEYVAVNTKRRDRLGIKKALPRCQMRLETKADKLRDKFLRVKL